MANHKSAKKSNRQAIDRTELNRARIGRVRSFIRKVEEAITKGDKPAAVAALREAQPEIARAAGKGVIKKETASRKISRLAQRIKKLVA
ncbi:MAG: ribosomal protein [Rickettsiales bacterium]|jgi:small subunit ribosomal protein S20|nr:ribosomal protein [Rickettsiales bacterium]